ncbi:MAG TPA: cytochrome c oxidase accessory protein CcoG [Polyangiales bacterium]|nr:cytochrome c oxidase accessory protein CcoG [Polyangiales bacterium]
MTVHLKLYDQPSSLHADGSRNFVHPADVRGRFDTRRRWIFAALIAWLAALPFWQIGGHPAVFLDFEQRSFYLFGATFNAQDAWLVFFLLTGLGFALIVVTALWGRVWCGYACPQTVFLEGIFRPIERLIEGPRSERLRRNAGPLSFDKAARKLLKHALFLALSFLVAHLITAYFVSLPRLYRMVLGSPAAHPEAFIWAFGLTALLYFDFFWFREQMCLVVCPYGRLQSVLTDHDSLVIGYDERRGEPRGKKGAAGAGDCVDCKRCVVVCPTGIDIRNGLQIDCIGCARCADACDDVMGKLGRASGLVRYDSQNGFAGKAKRLWRPRLLLYAGLGALGCVVASLAVASRTPFEANVLRLRDHPPFVVEGDQVRNAFEVHLVNKRSGSAVFELRGLPQGSLRYTIALPKLSIGELHDQRIPVFVDFPAGSLRAGAAAQLELRIDGRPVRVLSAPLIAPDLRPRHE